MNNEYNTKLDIKHGCHVLQMYSFKHRLKSKRFSIKLWTLATNLCSGCSACAAVVQWGCYELLTLCCGDKVDKSELLDTVESPSRSRIQKTPGFGLVTERSRERGGGRRKVTIDWQCGTSYNIWRHSAITLKFTNGRKISKEQLYFLNLNP